MLLIETEHLKRRFGRVEAVRDVTLRVPAGAVYAFLGPNGAGKTTTIRILLGLSRADGGAVNLFGAPFARKCLARVGALVEGPTLYPHLTGSENMQVRARLTGASSREIARALAIVRLERDAGRLVRGYSLGMRQRLALAQALLRSPQLLVLDEPTNGLDPAGISEIRELIRGLPTGQGITVFLSSHLLNEVEQVATHLGIVAAGRSRFEGTFDDLRARRGETITIGVDRPAEAERLLRDNGFTVHPAVDRRLSVIAAGREAAARLNALLVAAGFSVHHLSLERPSLEQAFFELTEAA
ncbi:MAG: ATP-binding cassette domain-containing protein [Bryobacteraceae bacterium]|nr:ATP-binding cassette domain-containing protein [Bryobacteraceae bacterium]